MRWFRFALAIALGVGLLVLVLATLSPASLSNMCDGFASEAEAAGRGSPATGFSHDVSVSLAPPGARCVVTWGDGTKETGTVAFTSWAEAAVIGGVILAIVVGGRRFFGREERNSSSPEVSNADRRSRWPSN